MRVVSVFGLAIGLAACGGGGERAAPAGPPSQPLIGVVWSGDTGTIARINPGTLRSLPGRRVPLGGHGGPFALSPDRSQVVFGGERSLRIVDLERMRLVDDIEAGRVVAELAWTTPRRLLVVSGADWEQYGMELAVVDPVTQRVLSQTRVDGRLQDVAKTSDGLVLLLEPRQGMGAASLVVFQSSGDVRSVVLDHVDAGLKTEQLTEELSVARYRTPGVTVDDEGARAFVVAAQNVVAEVDTKTMKVTYHTLRADRSRLERFGDWLNPVAEAKGLSNGSLRRALWLGDGRLAVYGWDDHAFLDSDGNPKQETTPGGVALIDTATWVIRTLVEEASEAQVVGETLLVYGFVGRGASGIGLRAYTLDGERRFHVLDDEAVWGVTAIGRHAYVNIESGWCEVAVVDLRAGRVVRDLKAYTQGCSWPSLLRTAD